METLFANTVFESVNLGLRASFPAIITVIVATFYHTRKYILKLLNDDSLSADVKLEAADLALSASFVIILVSAVFLCAVFLFDPIVEFWIWIPIFIFFGMGLFALGRRYSARLKKLTPNYYLGGGWAFKVAKKKKL